MSSNSQNTDAVGDGPANTSDSSALSSNEPQSELTQANGSAEQEQSVSEAAGLQDNSQKSIQTVHDLSEFDCYTAHFPILMVLGFGSIYGLGVFADLFYLRLVRYDQHAFLFLFFIVIALFCYKILRRRLGEELERLVLVHCEPHRHEDYDFAIRLFKMRPWTASLSDIDNVALLSVQKSGLKIASGEQALWIPVDKMTAIYQNLSVDLNPDSFHIQYKGTDDQDCEFRIENTDLLDIPIKDLKAAELRTILLSLYPDHFASK